METLGSWLQFPYHTVLLIKSVPEVKMSSDFIADSLKFVSYKTTPSSQELGLNTDQDVWTDVGRLITSGAGIVGC